MRISKDLTGQIFGRLIVIEAAKGQVSPRGKIISQWKCKCNCKIDNPNYVVVGAGSLKSGHTKSCGCYGREMRTGRSDLIGKKFGKLIVISYYGINKDSRTLWRCQCDCGSEEIILSGHRLNSGQKISCGCVHKERDPQSHKKYNTYDLTGEYGIGYTFKNKPFYFDLEDYDKIKDYCWHYNTNDYIANSQTDGKYGMLMHRLVMNCPDNMEVDHIFHVNHDNRKSKLRIVTGSQNSMNQRVNSNNTSGVKGVSWNKNSNKWFAVINFNKKSIKKGFEKKEDAIIYRKFLEEKYHGEYALKDNVIM